MLFLAGCSYLTPRQFDATEYMQTILITNDATRLTHQCAIQGPEFDNFLSELNTNSMVFLEYSKSKQNNTDVESAAFQIRVMVLEFDVKAKSSSKEYCIAKITNIQNASRTLARSLGRVDNYDMCHSNLVSIWNDLTSMKDKAAISQQEYVELSKDVTRLGKINIATCSLQDREKIEEGIAIISKALSFVPL